MQKRLWKLLKANRNRANFTQNNFNKSCKTNKENLTKSGPKAQKSKNQFAFDFLD